MNSPFPGIVGPTHSASPIGFTGRNLQFASCLYLSTLLTGKEKNLFILAFIGKEQVPSRERHRVEPSSWGCAGGREGARAGAAAPGPRPHRGREGGGERTRTSRHRRASSEHGERWAAPEGQRLGPQLPGGGVGAEPGGRRRRRGPGPRLRGAGDPGRLLRRAPRSRPPSPAAITRWAPPPPPPGPARLLRGSRLRSAPLPARPPPLCTAPAPPRNAGAASFNPCGTCPEPRARRCALPRPRAAPAVLELGTQRSAVHGDALGVFRCLSPAFSPVRSRVGAFASPADLGLPAPLGSAADSQPPFGEFFNLFFPPSLSF